jgi:hypothetical protein
MEKVREITSKTISKKLYKLISKNIRNYMKLNDCSSMEANDILHDCLNKDDVIEYKNIVKLTGDKFYDMVCYCNINNEETTSEYLRKNDKYEMMKFYVYLVGLDIIEDDEFYV